MPEPPDALCQARNRLNEVTALLHEPVTGHAFTPFQAMAEIARFVGREVQLPRLPLDGLAALDEAERRELEGRVRTFADLLARAGLRPNHPFAGVGATSLDPLARERITAELVERAPRALEAIGTLEQTAERLAELAGRPVPLSLPDCRDLQKLLLAAAYRPAEGRDATAALLPQAGCPPTS